MRKLYCDFCKNEITTIYHEIDVDNINFEICEECHTKFVDKLLSNVKRATIENKNLM